MQSYSPRYRTERNSVPKKNPLIALFVNGTILVITIIVMSLMGYNWLISKSAGNSTEPIMVRINPGDSREVVAKKLFEKGLIKNQWEYIWYSKISKAGSNVQAGGHTLSQNMTLKQIVASLESTPDDSTIWVTIPEGLRMDEIADILADGFKGKQGARFSKQRYLEIAENPQSGNFSSKTRDVIKSYLPEGKSLEGFLYPDTYNFDNDSTEEKIIETQINTLVSKIDKTNWKKIENNTTSLYDILNIASMLEREGRSLDEYYMISDIIERRIEQGITLGIDATLLYELKDWKAGLTYAQLAADTPYNTRVNGGLPPTPISNPGIETIDAAINPKDNEYLYYIHDNTGAIHYAKTNAEHERNIADYL